MANDHSPRTIRSTSGKDIFFICLAALILPKVEAEVEASPLRTSCILIPEVVLLELDKASELARRSMLEGLKVIENAVDEIAKKGVLGSRYLGDLKDALRSVRSGIKDDVSDALARVKAVARDSDKAVQIELAIPDVVEAFLS